MIELINILLKYYLTNPLIIFVLILGIIQIFFKGALLFQVAPLKTKFSRE